MHLKTDSDEVPRPAAAPGCGCNHSLAVISGAFAAIAVGLFLAEDACLDRGGRVSDSAWSCEGVAGAAGSLWSLLTPGIVAAMVLAGVLVYFAAAAAGRRANAPAR